MKSALAHFVFVGLAIAAAQVAFAQGGLRSPNNIQAGDGFSIQARAAGKRACTSQAPTRPQARYSLGRNGIPSGRNTGQRRRLPGFPAGTSSSENGLSTFRPQNNPRVRASWPGLLVFRSGFTKASPVPSLVFDAYHNLIDTPMPVSFELSSQSQPRANAHCATPPTARPGQRWTRRPTRASLAL